MNKAGVFLLLATGILLSSCDNDPVSADLPAGPTLISPANGAKFQPWKSTRLTWSPVTGATSYHLQISTSSTFATLSIDDSLRTVIEDPLQLDLTSSTTYFWRVRAKEVSGPGNWSAAWSFTTTTMFEGQWEAARKLNSDRWWYRIIADTIRIFYMIPNIVEDRYDTNLTYQGFFTFNPVDSNFNIQLMNAGFTAPTGSTIQTLYLWVGPGGSDIEFNIMENDPDAPRPADMTDLNKRLQCYFRGFYTGN